MLQHPSTRHFRRRAFTLLEMCTALGIFSFAVLGFLHALDVTVDAAREVQRQKTIRNELENRLARLSLPPLKIFSTKEATNGVQYAEEIRPEIVKADNAEIMPGYWRVTVKAEWTADGQPQQWDASHLVWNP